MNENASPKYYYFLLFSIISEVGNPIIDFEVNNNESYSFPQCYQHNLQCFLPTI